jgi:hypothetical protein
MSAEGAKEQQLEAATAEEELEERSGTKAAAGTVVPEEAVGIAAGPD